jgi:uncharacterized membrane protein (DUF441 family)
MSQPSWAGIITAFATLFIALGGFITAIGVLIPIARGTRETKAAIAEVHTLVNGNHTEDMVYQAQLIAALTAKGIDVPPQATSPRDK